MRIPSSFSMPLVCLIAALVLLTAPRPASAQAFELVGIRAQGMGGAFVAVADDATATWWNPAGLAAGPYFNALVEYGRSEHPDDTRASGIAVALPSLGLSYYRIPVSHIRSISPTDQSAADRQDQGALNQFGATVGQSLGQHVVIASTLKLDHAIDDTHVDLDIGAMVKYGSVHAGITVKNVREPSFGDGPDRLDLTRQVRAGAALTRQGKGRVDQVTAAFDADLTVTPTPVGDERHVSAGLEVWMLKRRLGVRGGGSADTVGDTRGSGSAGISVAFRSGFYLDGAYTGGSDETRNGWGAALRVTF
jgi:hypothetical protein